MTTNKKTKIQMTQEAYNHQLKILDDYIKTLNSSREPLSDAVKGIDSDGTSDNSAVQVELLETALLISKIRHQKEKISNIEVIDLIEEFDEQIVGIGDIVNIDLFYSENDIENIKVTLVADNSDFETNKVSIDTSMGMCILGHRIGENLSYKVKENEVKLTILGIEKVMSEGRVLKLNN